MDRSSLETGSPAPVPSAAPAYEPRSLGAYRILRRLGEGGMGSVYLGYHEGQGRQVAIKILSDQLAGNKAYLERFQREARSGALLNHPNIVRGLAVDRDPVNHQHYLVLEYVDGPSALALLEQHGRLSVGDAVHLALDVARALEHAHSRGVIHRDIKPDNILITRSGVAKLSDLGLARRIDEVSNLTGTRQGFGTPYYMPYEQAVNARQADARSDIYALGATLYHLVTGEVPFTGQNHLEVMDKKNQGDFPAPSSLNAEVPPALDRILRRMLARDPGQRYQTASELIVDLERSRLANPVLSFADADLARQDPWVQACMSASAQPTLPDMDGVAVQAKPAANGGPAEVWFLRRRDREGRWRVVRATREQIRRKLEAGRLASRVEASPARDGEYRSLNSYPEFGDVQPVHTRRRKPVPAPPKELARTIPLPPPVVARPRLWLWLAVAGPVLLASLAAAALVYELLPR